MLIVTALAKTYALFIQILARTSSMIPYATFSAPSCFVYIPDEDT